MTVNRKNFQLFNNVADDNVDFSLISEPAVYMRCHDRARNISLLATFLALLCHDTIGFVVIVKQ